MTSNCRNLTIGYAHRKSEFFAISHQLTVDAGRGFVVGEHALIEGQRDKLFKSFAKP